jgi:peptide deformylase
MLQSRDTPSGVNESMTVLSVIEWPAKVLSTKSEEVKVFDDELRSFVKDMHETMASAGGIGLAANQVNVAKRVLTINIPFSERDAGEEEEVREYWHDKAYTFINPVITKRAGKISWQEGCLSFPEVYEFIDRSKEVWVDAIDEHGKPFSVHATGLFAVCLQHEIDHIDGIVFIDRMSRLKASLAKAKIQKRIQQRPSKLEMSVEK